MPRNSIVLGWQATRDGNVCGSELARGNTGGGDNACLNPPAGGSTFAGGSWAQGSKKRYAAANDLDQECIASQKADALVLSDGTKYELEGMEQSLAEELYDLAVNGTATEDIPEVFAAFAATK